MLHQSVGVSLFLLRCGSCKRRMYQALWKGVGLSSSVLAVSVFYVFVCIRKELTPLRHYSTLSLGVCVFAV